MPTITELNEIIGRIKAVQKRFSSGDGTTKVTDNSFGGRVQRAKVRQHNVLFYEDFFPFSFRKKKIKIPSDNYMFSPSYYLIFPHSPSHAK
jgi:hypothetical protein